MEVMAPISTLFHDPVGVIGARCPNIAVVDEQPADGQFCSYGRTSERGDRNDKRR